MAILTDTGAAFVAQSVFDNVGQFYIAWGEGDAGWDALSDIPEPEAADTGLVAHLGHLKATAQYVVPDEAGLLSSASGERWTASADPTPYIYLHAPYDYEDEPTAVIRELAVYADPTRANGVADNPYLPVVDLADLGRLFQIERINAKQREPEDDGAAKLVIKVMNADA